jgi:hypothetical protein
MPPTTHQRSNTAREPVVAATAISARAIIDTMPPATTARCAWTRLRNRAVTPMLTADVERTAPMTSRLVVPVSCRAIWAPSDRKIAPQE